MIDSVLHRLDHIHRKSKAVLYSRFSYLFISYRYPSPENGHQETWMYTAASSILRSKFLFFSPTTFRHDRQFHNKRHQFQTAIDYLINNRLAHEASGQNRFIRGVHTSYALATPTEIKNSHVSITALAKLGLNVDDYNGFWRRCLLPTPELALRLERSAIDRIRAHLDDYIAIIHRLGDSNDPLAQIILKPGLRSGEVGIDFDSNNFSLKSDHMVHFDDDKEILKTLSRFCTRAIVSEVNSLIATEPAMSVSSQGQDRSIIDNGGVSSNEKGMLLCSLTMGMLLACRADLFCFSSRSSYGCINENQQRR
jgi:hypothetical protein